MARRGRKGRQKNSGMKAITGKSEEWSGGQWMGWRGWQRGRKGKERLEVKRGQWVKGRVGEGGEGQGREGTRWNG